MAKEIERKFLIAGDGWKGLTEGVFYHQGYLCSGPERSVRVRIAGDHGYLTVKGATTGATRNEYEYEIPLADARDMLDNLCPQPQIEKKRYTIIHQGSTWEIDEFSGANQGLIIAEIELTSEDQSFELPDWVGREVTGDVKYYNAVLCAAPYTTWSPPS